MLKEIKVFYHGDLKEIIKSKGNLDENGNILEGLGHIGGKSKSSQKIMKMQSANLMH